MADSPDKSLPAPTNRDSATSIRVQDETLPSTKTDLSERTRQLLSLRYDLLDKLGSGGMGIVYKARDRETGEIIALKVLKSTLTDDPTLMERFRNELRLARRITHHNVCRIYDFNRVDDSAFISMEFVDGSSLRELLNPGKLEVPKVLDIARQICAGLGEAHSQGIIHRDLKPENVMLDRLGDVKLMDFGIARSLDTRSTATGSFLGTPAYMAPEQAEGKPADRRSDIYSLGLVLYEMCAGQAAFSGDTPLAVALKQIRETPPSPRVLQPDLPAQVEYVILKCLCKDPAKRFQAVEEVEAALAEGATRDASEPLQAPNDETTKQNPPAPVASDLVLFSLIQLLYVGFYLAALAKLERIDILTESFTPGWGWPMVVVVTVSALVGLAIRIYFLTAIAFHYPGLWGNFSRIFLLILVLDELWAMSPFLLAHRIGFGLSFAATVPLLFLPFSQRTLLSLYFRKGPADWRTQKTMPNP